MPEFPVYGLVMKTKLRVDSLGLTGRFAEISLLACLLTVLIFSGCAKQVTYQPAAPEKPQPIKARTLEQKAYSAMQRGDFDTGILLYQRVLEKDPANARAMYHLGFAYGQMGDHELEISYYENAIELKYRTAQIYYNLGAAHLALDRVEEAIYAFKRGVKKNPGSADNYCGLGRAYQERLEYALAEKELLRAVDLSPEDIVFREYLGFFYEETGQLQKAAEQYRIILEIDSEYEGARERLEHVVKKQEAGEESHRGKGGQ